MKSGFKEEPAATSTVASGRPPNSTGRLKFGAFLLGVVLLVAESGSGLATAADFLEGFDSETPSWQPIFEKRAEARLKRHRRNSSDMLSGDACEELQVVVGTGTLRTRFEQELPQSAPIEDVELSVALRSNVPGCLLALRMVFPQQIDPRTGRTLIGYLQCEETYQGTGRWQTLTVKPTRRSLTECVARLRAQLKPAQLQLGGMFFDRAVLFADLDPGTSEFLIDDLAWTGYAAPATFESRPGLAPRREIVQTKAEEPRPQNTTHVQLQQDRLLVDGKPAIVRFTPHHDEPLERLQALGLNVVWINDYTDTKRIQHLRDLGMYAMATPPRTKAGEPDPSGSDSLQLAPFDHKTDGILIWNLAVRAPREAREELGVQARQVRAADRQRQRPIMADIGGLERSYSRILDGVGLTRHPLQTEFSIKDYREFLRQKTRQLRPGTFVSTWLQTEIETPAEMPVVSIVEPEQVRQLAYAALSAGCRGIGYWKWSAFNAEFPGARERELMIAITNQEIDLLEPWLATHSFIEFQRVPLGRKSAEKPAVVDTNRPQSTRLRVQPSNSKTAKPEPEKFQSLENSEIEMAIVQSPRGTLLLPMWYEQDSQYVPGLMAARDIDITIPGIPDTATVWELTTTRVGSLKQERVSGGIKVRLKNFDQVAAIVVSTDPNFGRDIKQKVDAIQQRSATMWLSLAKAKLERVKDVDAQLQQLGHGLPSSVHRIDRATTQVRLADSSYERALETARSIPGGEGDDLDRVRECCGIALQELRVLQRDHWEHAVRGRPSPLFSQYTASFQSLPEHWRFVERLGAGAAVDVSNRLELGNFEGISTEQLIAAGWKHSQDDVEGVQAGAELTQSGGNRGFTLRLLSLPKPNTDPPVSIEATPISVTTPAIPVRAGQIVHLSGWVRVPIPATATLEGASLQESLTGSRLLWKQTRGWERFELVREATSDTTVSLKLTHHGLGEVQFDDLKIVAYDASAMPQNAGLDSPKRSPKVPLP